MLSRMILLCVMSVLASFTVSGVSINNCDGLICPENTACSVSTSNVNGKLKTERKCIDVQGNVVARSASSGNAGSAVNSNFVMSGGGGSCLQQTNSINGVTTSIYRCDTGNGSGYYVTNINGVYKNCTSVPLNAGNGVTTTQEQCFPMSEADIQRVRLMEQEMQRKAAEVDARMKNMAVNMQAKNHQLQNQMMEDMNNMQRNMQHSFGETMERARQTQNEMMRMGEEVRNRAMNTASQLQTQGQAAMQSAMQGINNMRQNFQNTFSNMFQ